MNNCIKIVGDLLTRVVERRHGESPGLKTKPSVRDRTRAPMAGAVTSSGPPAAPVEAPPRGKRMSRQDLALRKLAAEASPGRCHTLHEIAEVMGITRERVRQIEMKAKRKFRNRLTILLKSEGVSPGDISAVFSAAHLE